ncbi:hypothetical protein DTO027I6_2749 [Penicillium roqueforti]|uniref:uncharacterized protein n=1 Tax=Penicillium roqueforti TaxID=5082 RepID=UPI00190A6C68|nr:uncharacterized protein LCP9604111_1260 [Penicillium roqueforti]KAF9253734.1 hypothetical protein LCP9604111_1260 [Penicillium roqueforti]KAI2686252.1 hypothetical protein CBS147355_1739 [Penicillium roqueforti]KAI2687394.1 hypothetical protein LCP963914a_3995 [Penicillium roqueforti]KAI2706256.1 hypothetical protein CBS147372_167 [Penicillium roqueforti]KAI2711810.1 hypothetical protein CBS147354_8194 [Penicillium roqueforti]
MFRRPDIPRNAFAIMPLDRQRALLRKQAREMTTTRSVSEFLEGKIRDYRMDLDYISCAHDGLLEVLDNEKITTSEFITALKPLMTSARRTSDHLKFLSNQRKAIQDDLEELPPVKRQRQGELDVEFLERAYTATICPKVMSAGAKVPKERDEYGRSFNASNFKRDVCLYYDIPKDEFEGHCHVIGSTDAKSIKAAHLVPKSLRGDEIAHLFGVGAIVSSDPRNALSLHYKVEEALDSGKIVIVPILEDEDVTTPSRWKCVLAHEAMRHTTVMKHFTKEDSAKATCTTWDDLDGKELKFLSDARPAKRFLYFRFIITYIHCKKEGNLNFTKKVENIRLFWPTPGEYLCKSMLKTLSRSISGHKLPDCLVQERTFEDFESTPGTDEATSGIIVAEDIYQAMIVSIKEPPGDNDEEEEEASDSDLDEPAFMD